MYLLTLYCTVGICSYLINRQSRGDEVSRLRVHVRVLGCPQAEGPGARGRLQLGAQGRGLVVGVGDRLQESVHLPQGQRVVERLQRPDVGGPVLPNWKCDHKFVSE